MSTKIIHQNPAYLNLPLEVLHQTNKYWLSETEFWKEEVVFLQSLINKHFVQFLAKDTFASFQPLVKKVKELQQKNLPDLKKLIDKHELDLVGYIKNPDEKKESKFRKDHEMVGKKVNEFENAFRLVKKEVFRLAEEVLADEKHKLLMA